LARFANREAADYLRTALNLAPRSQEQGSEGSAERFALMEDLARARQRLGEYEEAILLWRQARSDAAARGDRAAVAAMERRIGVSHFWAARYAEALVALDAALEAAEGIPHLLARIGMARGVCLEFMGRGAEAGQEMERALAAAEESGAPGLLARVHRSLLLLHAWSGSADAAREHGRMAIALAEQAGDLAVAAASHWGMAVLEGLTGHGEACVQHVRAGEALADVLRSPLLRLSFTEITVEYASGSGDWENGIALGEQAIALARSLNQRAILPRLLVWTGLIHLGRGELERARALLEEAWRLSGADEPERARDVHSLVPAHTGMAAYHLAMGNQDEAIRVGEAGLAIADRTGYTIWAVHRLLAVVGEAYLDKRELEMARAIGERLRRDAERMGHVLGIAWADACEAVLAWLEGDDGRSAELLRQTAERLEAVPFLPDAARLRRHLAARLRDLGDREGALRELRHVHDVFLELGAREELRRARLQIRELGARPPVRPSGDGAAGLTGREVEIVRLVADRKSNKSIARELGISPRTVTTHLSNIFQKLEIGSRAELAEMAPVITLDA
jgi:DNA-binding CsgD family transcriptional regulator